MASSNHTANLGLCSWAATDRPKRADFVSDNSIIDSVLGGHVSNTAVHLSAEEKSKALTPFEYVIYSGNGESSRDISVGFRPTIAFVFKRSAPPAEYSDGVNTVNSGCGIYAHGTTLGVSINSTGVTVTQENTASNGRRISLNEQGCQYSVIAFK